MKRTFLTFALLAATLCVLAIPAKRGKWKTLQLSDGTSVKAMLQGDEWGHFWKGTDGKRYVNDGGTYVVQSKVAMKQAAEKRMKAQQLRAKRNPMMRARQEMMARGTNTMPEVTALTGNKKGLIILVSFKDVDFQQSDAQTKSLFNNIANTENYSENGFKGSVADYFKAQSRGNFNLSFDVVGPYKLSQNAEYYGGNDDSDSDMHPEAMVTEAVNAAKADVSNWKQYDWDNDGEVDQVMIIYAGEGEASGGDETTIWPHEWEISASGIARVEVGTNLYVDTYACANEVDYVEDELGNGGYQLTGVGTICHEFSHCLGLMDMYDTSYSGFYGMGNWSLMDQGSNNAEGFQPCNYTSFERMSIGWVTPEELTTAKSVTEMKSLTDADEFYKVTNKGNSNEYYLLENRQRTGWDASLPAAGLLIMHVDYDDDIWAGNMVNTANDDLTYGPLNDHQRCTIFHADGVDRTGPIYEKIEEVYNKIMDAYYDTSISDAQFNALWDQYEALWDEYDADVIGDVYPQAANNQLTNTTTPRAFTYNANSDGRKLMNVAITDITQNGNGTISFNFAPDNSGTEEGDNTNYKYEAETVLPEGTLFYESFNSCAGTGGNDGAFSGTVASSTFKADNTGWTSSKPFGGDKCAKFGTGSVKGTVTTPSFTINGTAEFSFKAAPFGTDGTTLQLSVPSGFTISPASVTMTAGKWTTFKVTITGTGSVAVTLTPAKRLFLDEVLAVDPNATTGINSLTTAPSPKGEKSSYLYNLNGQRVGKDYKGIVIKNGRKFFKN